MRINRSAVILSAIALTLGLGGAATASAAAPAKPKAYGFCASKTTGAWRMMLPTRPNKSQWGTCRKGEVKYLMPTRHAIPAVPTTSDLLPAKFTITFDGVKGTCTRGTDVAGVPDYSCAKPTASPSPTPSS